MLVGFRQSSCALLLRTLILELRPLGSAGITRFQRYYEPLRHRRDRA